MKVPIRKFKAELSRYIREASAGKDVVVTSRGKPVARILPPLVPAASSKSLSREELRAKLKALIPGIRIGKGEFKLPRQIIKIRPGERTMAEIVRRRPWAALIVYFDTSALMKLFVGRGLARPCDTRDRVTG